MRYQRGKTVRSTQIQRGTGPCQSDILSVVVSWLLVALPAFPRLYTSFLLERNTIIISRLICRFGWFGWVVFIRVAKGAPTNQEAEKFKQDVVLAFCYLIRCCKMTFSGSFTISIFNFLVVGIQFAFVFCHLKKLLLSSGTIAIVCFY